MAHLKNSSSSPRPLRGLIDANYQPSSFILYVILKSSLVLFSGGILIGHDDLRGAINQIPNIWDEWEREELLDLDWVVAVESPTCRRKWVIRSESFPSFYFRLLCSVLSVLGSIC